MPRSPPPRRADNRNEAPCPSPRAQHRPRRPRVARRRPAGRPCRRRRREEAGRAARPALSVVVTQPQRATLPLRIAANGNIAAWQEAIIGTEANGLRLADVQVNVGDVRASAARCSRRSRRRRSRPSWRSRGRASSRPRRRSPKRPPMPSARAACRRPARSATQQIDQYMTAEQTAQARLDAQRAAARAQQLRLAQTAVLAPDDGVISARSATVGAVLPAGQELFRMIRKGRLEWRAEVDGRPSSRCVNVGMPVTRDDRRRRASSRARCAWSRRPSIRRPATAWSTSTCRRPDRGARRHVRARRVRPRQQHAR